jgi:DNA-binding CsgD family transcriptional regulator
MLTNELLEFITKSAEADTLNALWSMTSDHLETQGITHSVYAYLNSGGDPSVRIYTQMPDYWRAHYLEANYDRIDPFFKYCCDAYTPVRTGSQYLHDHPFLTAREQCLIREAGETGFLSGFAAPVRLIGRSQDGFGGWNFGSTLERREFEALISEHGASLWLTGILVHERMERIARTPQPRPNSTILTDREKDCLLWLARGLRSDAIADRLNIARITVDVHFRNARGKLGVPTREAALAKAILLGLIKP